MAEPARVRKAAVEGAPTDVDAESPHRRWVAKAFTRLEDVVYIGLSLLLAGVALVLLVTTVVESSSTSSPAPSPPAWWSCWTRSS